MEIKSTNYLYEETFIPYANCHIQVLQHKYWIGIHS